MPSKFRSKVKEIMSQYRSGDLKAPPSDPNKPTFAAPAAFDSKWDAKKYAFDAAKAGLDKVPGIYEKRYDKIAKRADKPATEVTTKPMEPGKLEDTPAKRKIKLQKKARRMKRRGLNDVYDVQGVKPYKEHKTPTS